MADVSKLGYSPMIEYIVSSWSEASANPMSPFFRSALVTGLTHISSCLAKDARFLDVGCGRGALGSLMCDIGLFVGFDLNPDALAKAREHAPDSKFVRGNAEYLPFRNGSFDAVCSMSVLQYMNWKIAIQECARVLRPGGRAFFIENLLGNPFARLYRIIRNLAIPYPRYMKPMHHIDWSERNEFDSFFERTEFSAFHIFTPLVLTMPTFDQRSFYTDTNGLFLRLFGGLARLDRFLLNRWPRLASMCWNILILVEKKEDSV
jgi:SAM-dependent methyltransferase